MLFIPLLTACPSSLPEFWFRYWGADYREGEEGAVACAGGYDLDLVFGTRVLASGLRVVPDGGDSFFERRDHGFQRHIVGMPLEIDVECYDEDGKVVGRSSYVGRLERLSRAAVTVTGGPVHEGCEPARIGEGVQVCVYADGFDFSVE